MLVMKEDSCSSRRQTNNGRKFLVVKRGAENYHCFQCQDGPAELQRLMLVVKNAELPFHPSMLFVRSVSFFSILVY